MNHTRMSDINPHNAFTQGRPILPVKGLAIAVSAVGLIVLFGWTLDIDILKRLLPGLVTMKANTAAAFLLSGTCLYLHLPHFSSSLAILLRRASALLVALIGLVTLGEYIFGWEAGIDQLLFKDSPEAILTSHPGRMSDITALNFFLAGGALLLMEVRLWAATQAMIIAMMLTTLMALAGYIAGNLSYTRIGFATSIAAHTVVNFLFLGAGVLAFSRNFAIMATFRKHSLEIGFVSGLAVLIFVFAASFYNYTREDKVSDWVEQTYETMASMDMLDNSIHDYLYHNRGYVITGDDIQLEESNKRLGAMRNQLENVYRLTADHPEQHKHLNDLDKLVQQSIQVSDQLIQLRREKGIQEAARLTSSNVDFILLSEIENKLEEMQALEKNLLKERQSMAEAIGSSSFFTLGMLLASSVLMLMLTYGARLRENRERGQKEQLLRESEAKLKQERDNLQNIVGSMGDGVYIVNANYDIEYVNPVIEKTFGPVLGRKCHEYFHGRPEICPWCKNQEVFAGRPVRWEFTVEKTGQTFDLYDAPLRNPDGSISKIEFLHDITGLRHTEEALRASETRLRLLLDSTAEAIYGIDLRGKCTFCNPSCLRLLGYDHVEDLLGKDTHTLFHYQHPDGRPYLAEECPVYHTCKTGQIMYVENEVFWRADGTSFPVEYRSHPQLLDEKIVGAVITFLDITERKRAEQELRSSEERLALATRTGNIGIWDWDVTNNILLWDDSMYQLYGIRHEDFGSAYESWASTLHPEDRAHTEGEIQAALRGEREYAPEFRILRPDGSVRYIKAASHTLFDDNGKAVRMVGVNYDLTERRLAEESLRNSEHRLKEAQRIAHIGDWDLDLINNRLTWSDEIFRLFEIDPEKFGASYETFLESIHPDDRDMVNMAYTESVNNKTPYDIEHRLLMHDGRVKYVSERCETYYDKSGKPIRSFGTVHDITDVKQAEQELRSSEERFRAYFERSMVGMATTSLEKGWINVNDALCKTLGYSREELAHLTWSQLTHPDDFAPDVAQFNRVLSGEINHYAIDKRFIHKDGHTVYTRLAVSCVRKTDGSPDYFVALVEDITERKHGENIQLARGRLINYSYSHSLKELLVATLDEACALTGSLIGFYHFVDPDQVNLTLQAWSTRTTQEFCKAQGEGMHYPISEAGVWVDCVRERRPIIHNNYHALPHKRGMPPGHAHVERELVVPIFRNEQIVAILGIGNKPVPYDDKDLESVTQLADLAWDIAAASRALEDVRQLNASLEQRVKERTSQLEEANKDLESFSYSVSHDLRSPLRSIDGFSRILLEDYKEKLDAEGQRLLNVLSSNALKMGELIDDILAFSRASRQEVERSDVNMEEMAHEIMRELDPVIAGRKIELEVGALPHAFADHNMMRQVLLNLLNNAVKYTQVREEAVIEIGAEAGDREIIYHVKDNGTGFDMRYAGKLFGVFQRLHSHEEFEGTGIGLAIVKRIIAKHGGRVWAEGKVNGGATFYFALPEK